MGGTLTFFFEKMAGGGEMTEFAIKTSSLCKTRKMDYAIFSIGKVDGKEKIVCKAAQGQYLVKKKEDEKEYVKATLEHCKKKNDEDDEKDSEVVCVAPKKNIKKKVGREIHKWKNDDDFTTNV